MTAKLGSLLAGVALCASTLIAAPARADITVAIAGPMTGQYASAGAQIRRGAELAITDINTAGGVLGQKLKLEIGDDACDPKQAVSVANAMVNKKIVFMHGHWCSSSTIPASDIYNEAQIPMATVSTNPQVTERGLKNLVRIMGRDDQQGGVAGAFIASHFAGKKVAVVDDKSAYGKGLADQTAKGMEAKGAKPALRESISAGEKDYSGLVSKLKAAEIEVLAFGGYHTEVALILRQSQQAGLKLAVVGGDTLSNNELVAAAGGNADSVYFTFAPDARSNPEAADVVKRFRDAKVEPDGYVLFAYAAMQLFQQAAEQAKSVKYAALQKAISTGSFNTVTGTLSFDDKGNLKAPGFVVYQWKGNKYDVIK